MKTLILLLLLALPLSGQAATLEDFARAVNLAEAAGHDGPVYGDHGQALGPLQIHRQAFKDSGIKGHYRQCANYTFSLQVMQGYLRRFAPVALQHADWSTCARVWNGGPDGCRKPQTIPYAKRVLKNL